MFNPVPALHHGHDHPVCCIHVLPDEILEHDERLHQEVLLEIKPKPAHGGVLHPWNHRAMLLGLQEMQIALINDHAN